MRRHVRLLTPAALLAAALVAATPADAATRYADHDLFLVAIGGGHVTESFESFSAGTVLTTQIAGVAFSSPIAPFEGAEPVGVVTSARATSGTNALSGGLLRSDPELLQVIGLDFEPAIRAVGFWLLSYHPEATPLHVRLSYPDETSETLEVTNDTGDETLPVFFGAITDRPVAGVTLTSGREGGFFEEFSIDDLIFATSLESDTLPPICSGDPVSDGGASIAGTATDDREGDSGIAAIALEEGALNLTLEIDTGFEPGAPSASFDVRPADSELDARGTVVVTDGAEQSCRLPVAFRRLGAGPLADETLCEGDGIVFSVSNDEATPAGTSACSAALPTDDDPDYPPGYESSPAADPSPCRVLTIDSPISGLTEMTYDKDGAFEPRLRLLYSRFDGAVFPPFADVTESVEPIVVVIDPTRVKGTVSWSPVKVACALQSETCNGLDDDGDGLVDEGLPVGDAEIDFDGDGFALCPAAGETADCNDQIASIHPAAGETCNGLDDDCDGAPDDGNPGGGDGCVVPGVLGACAGGSSRCFESRLACDQTVFPSAEVCDGADNDCDGTTDEGYAFGGYQPPVNPDGSSIFKSRRVVPFKFSLVDCAGAPVPDATATLEIFFFAAGVVGTEFEEVASRAASDTGNLYRFDASSGQYIYNLDLTPLPPGNSFLVRTTLADGSAHDVVISIQ